MNIAKHTLFFKHGFSKVFQTICFGWHTGKAEECSSVHIFIIMSLVFLFFFLMCIFKVKGQGCFFSIQIWKIWCLDHCLWLAGFHKQWFSLYIMTNFSVVLRQASLTMQCIFIFIYFFPLQQLRVVLSNLAPTWMTKTRFQLHCSYIVNVINCFSQYPTLAERRYIIVNASSAMIQLQDLKAALWDFFVSV